MARTRLPAGPGRAEIGRRLGTAQRRGQDAQCRADDGTAGAGEPRQRTDPAQPGPDDETPDHYARGNGEADGQGRMVACEAHRPSAAGNRLQALARPLLLKLEVS